MPTFHPAQIAWGFVLAAAVAAAAYRLGALTLSGALSATVMGTVVFGLGGWPCALPLLVFFATSSALSRWRRRAKEGLDFEKTGRRDAAQVWANGGIAAACVLLPFLSPEVGAHRAYLLFLAALAGANADTWATEIGAALGGTPRLITTGRGVERGASGGVTGAGLLAAGLGSALIGAFAGGWRGLAVVLAAGWVGALLDSLLGATVQAKWLRPDGRLTERPAPGASVSGLPGVGNDVVNLLCTLAAVEIAALLGGR